MENNLAFIGRKLAELREANNLSQQELAKKIGCDPTVISKIESGKRKKIRTHVDEYIQAMKCPVELADEIMRAVKIAVPDTSALMYYARLIDDLCDKYDKVVVPDVIIKELQCIKDKKDKDSRKAWEILRSIGEDNRIICYRCDNDLRERNDSKIIDAVRKAVNELGGSADIITNDADFPALLKGDNEISAIHVKDFIQIHHNITNMLGLDFIDQTYLDDYSDFKIPDNVDINEYLPNGNTLIISTIRNNKINSIPKKKEKIEWLIKNGADVNKRDRSKAYFPPLTHAIQINNYELFIFLLKECHANPNVGSKNPYSSKLLRQQNEGNMPLMVAAYHGRWQFVKALCDDKRTSINQQDANGYTALIKAAIKRWEKCCKILIDAGADTRIIDHHDMTASDRFEYIADYIYEKENGND